MISINQIQKVSIIGAGSWGTTIAKVIAENFPEIKIVLWAYEKDVTRSILDQKENKKFLPGVILPENLTATSNLKEVVVDTHIILLATPSKVIYETSQKIARYLNKAECIAFLSKGFCKIDNTILTISQTIEKAIPAFKQKVVAILGPSHAEEVSNQCHTCLNIASQHQASREIISQLLSSSYLQCREHNDIIGVEIGGTLKNPAAIAAGMISAMPKCGDNLEGALITEAIREMISLAKIFNVSSETILDISGLGDLVATALSDHSRNRRFGKDIANQIINKEQRIKFFDKLRLRIKPSLIIQKMSEKFNYLAEGAYAIEPLIELANKHNISIPVYRSLYEVLLNRKEPTLLIETIKDPNKFYELYKTTRYQMSERKKGLEKVKGKIFKNIIIKRVGEHYLVNKENQDSNKLEITNLIQNLKNSSKISSKSITRQILSELELIKGLTEKNYNEYIGKITRLYTKQIVDSHNPYFRKIIIKLIKLYRFIHLFNKNKGNIHITGDIPSLYSIGSASNIIYLPQLTSLYDFLYICSSIPRIRMPFPRFFVNSKAVTSKFKARIIKFIGGYIIDTEKLSNILYKEVISQYIATMIEYGVPLLYVPHVEPDNDTMAFRNSFFTLLNETFLRNPVEIVLIPIEITYDSDFYNKNIKQSYRKLFNNNVIINFSRALHLSQYAKENHADNQLLEKINAVWYKDKCYFPHILFAKILTDNNVCNTIADLRRLLKEYKVKILTEKNEAKTVKNGLKYLIRLNYISIKRNSFIIHNKAGLKQLASMIN